MPTLQGISGQSLVPNFSQALGILGQAFGTPETRDQRRLASEGANLELEKQRLGLERAQREDALIKDLFGDPGAGPEATKTPNQEKIERLTAINPELGRAVSGVMIAQDQEGRKAIAAEAERGGRNAAFISSRPDFAAKQRAISSLATQAAARGEPLDRFIELQNLAEPELDLELQRMAIASQDIDDLFASASGAAVQPFVTGTSSIIEKPDGTQAIVTPVTDKRTGDTRLEEAPIEEGQLVSRTGETPSDLTTRRALEAFLVREAQRGVEIETAAPLSKQEKRGAATETRQQEAINRGLAMADSLPNINRAIELLDTVGTGGFDQAAFSVRQFFGVEGADEGELSSNLGKAVVSQLRETFGAQFTAGEGQELKRIEAGFGRSPEANRRLLGNTKELVLKLANRGIRAAQAGDDQFAADEIQNAIDFSLNSAPAPAPAAPEGALAPGADVARPQSQADFDGLPSGTPFIDPEDGVLRRKN